MPELFFEDFSPGETIALESARAVTRDEIIHFARQFDPQPFHLDEEAAKRSLLGGLAASGWHTCAMVMRLNYDVWISRTASMGAPGIDEVRWAKPVRPGDRLRGRVEIRDKRVSRSRPDMGLVGMSTSVANDAGDVVFTQTHTQMIALRRPAEPDGSGSAPPVRDAGPAAASTDAADVDHPLGGWFEDFTVGARRELGQASFTKEEIVAFARDYDPQPFHLDEEAARRSHFGRLAASGWHTAATWMRTIIAARDRIVRERAAQGLETAPAAPSPGFTAMRWIKPVHAGDTLTYSTRVADKRATSRPGWGLVFSDNLAVNQHGEPVFSFGGIVFAPMRG